mgnify:CR=1 FL=1
MSNKTKLKTMIRQMVREEVAMAINEVVTELKQPSLSSKPVSQPKPQKKIVEKKTFAKNSVLNDILNETAQEEEWKTMGGGTYDSNRAGEVLSSQYGDMMNGNKPVSVDGQTADFLNKDYSKLLKKVDEKAKQTRG